MLYHSDNTDYYTGNPLFHTTTFSSIPEKVDTVHILSSQLRPSRTTPEDLFPSRQLKSGKYSWR